MTERKCDIRVLSVHFFIYRIEGIFVSEEMQSCGIGKLLLDYIKDKKVRLQLNVYQKNARAISLFNVKVWMKLLVKKSTLCYGNKNKNRDLSTIRRL